MATFKYIFDKADKTYKTGSQNNGIGIFEDNVAAYYNNKFWQANIVVCGDIVVIGPRPSFKEIKVEAEKEFLRLHKEFDVELDEIIKFIPETILR